MLDEGNLQEYLDYSQIQIAATVNSWVVHGVKTPYYRVKGGYYKARQGVGVFLEYFFNTRPSLNLTVIR